MHGPAKALCVPVLVVRGRPQFYHVRHDVCQAHRDWVALHFMHYNFCRIHKTIRVTPAMEAGLSGHVWTVEELVAILPEPVAKKRGPYKKRTA